MNEKEKLAKMPSSRFSGTTSRFHVQKRLNKIRDITGVSHD